jgi:hypothetical protein
VKYLRDSSEMTSAKDLRVTIPEGPDSNPGPAAKSIPRSKITVCDLRESDSSCCDQFHCQEEGTYFQRLMENIHRSSRSPLTATVAPRSYYRSVPWMAPTIELTPSDIPNMMSDIALSSCRPASCPKESRGGLDFRGHLEGAVHGRGHPTSDVRDGGRVMAKEKGLMVHFTV